MTKEAFHQLLGAKQIDFEVRGEVTFIYHGRHLYLQNEGDGVKVVDLSSLGYVNLSEVTELPENVNFSNAGLVHLDNLKEIPKGTEFHNFGDIDIPLVRYIPAGTKFNNKGHIYAHCVKAVAPDVSFENTGDVYIEGLDTDNN